MDRVGAGEQLHGLFQRLRFDRFQKSLKRGAPGLGKFGQKCWRSTCRCFTQMQEAGGIIRPAARIGFAKKGAAFPKTRKPKIWQKRMKAELCTPAPSAISATVETAMRS